MRFDAAGHFLSQWGAPGSGPGEFDLPHGVALDRAGRVYVVDRGNSRVQLFDSTGQFLAQWKGAEIGRPFGIAVSPDGDVYTVDGGDLPRTPPDRSGVTHLAADGRVLERFGRYGNEDGQFRIAHDVAVGRDGAIYVVDILGQRLQKFTCTR